MHWHDRSLALAALLITALSAAVALAIAGRSLSDLFAPSTLRATSPAPSHPRPAPSPGAIPAPSRPGGHAHHSAHRPFNISGPLRFAAADSVICLTGLIALAALLVKQRLDAREDRAYGMFEVHLSMHDDAQPGDLRDMVEALTAAVREWQVDRARHGQPFFALELHYGSTADGIRFLIALRCERDLAGTLESIIAGAYPDVRVGQVDGSAPIPIQARLRTPGYVLRLRKERSFLYPLSVDEHEDAGSPPMEAIAQAQVAAGVASSVRLQFTPAPLALEGWARRRFRAHERGLPRPRGRTSSDELRSVLDREEMRSARRARDSGLLWFEIQVAAPTGEYANRIAAALIARRGENRLQRRRMVLRRELYRRRFPDACPPLWPTWGFGGFHSLASATEVAHLLTLPTARMKAVPVVRLTVPRLPPPPQIARAEDLPVRLPPSPAPEQIAEFAQTRALSSGR